MSPALFRVPAVLAVAVAAVLMSTGPATSEEVEPIEHLTVPAQDVDPTGVVYVVQGVPNLSVDVEIDGQDVATLGTGDVAGPYELDEGASIVRMLDAGGAEIVATSIDVEADSNSDLVLHLPEEGADPISTLFENQLHAVPDSKAAVTVAHTAAIGAADVLIDDEVLFSDITNGEYLRLVVPADTYDAKIVPAGDREPVILGPETIDLVGGSFCRMYAIGDPETGTVSFAPHVFDVANVGSEVPNLVNTGTGGLVRNPLFISVHPAL